MHDHTSQRFDVIIVGGGLAGLINAIELGQAGFKTLLIEKKSYPRHKVCGEYVSNEVRPYLERLGAFPASIRPKAIHRFQLSASNGASAQCEMAMGGFGISRYAFDQFLGEKARATGAEILTDSTVEGVKFEDDRFKVQLMAGPQFSASVVIAAHGKRSLLDKALARDFIQQKSSYVGVKQHYRAEFPNDLVALHNFEGGYCGLSRVENDHVNLCYLTTDKVFQRYGGLAAIEQNLLASNPYLKRFLAQAEPVFEQPLVISQVNFAAKPLVEGQVLMCGDAAGLIHPLCGNGMAMAIHGAQLCSNAVKNFLRGEISRKEMEELYARQWQQQFRARLDFGRRVQRLFGRESLSRFSVGLARQVPWALREVVKRSHGRLLS